MLLLGNAAHQDTAVDPYSGDPVVARDWVVQTLGRRFVRIPDGISLIIEPAASGLAETRPFTSAFGPDTFDRTEAVTTEGGIVIHYAYRAEASARPRGPVDSVGMGLVVYNGEVYSLLEGRRWALQAPTYGFTFAARFCTVMVELPHSFGARPDQYRQFLRFVDGDQHQIELADFGDLVRRNIPAWLKLIIDSLLPDEGEYLEEIKRELQELLQALGVEDAGRARPLPQPPAEAADAQTPQANAAAPLPRKPPLPNPPEIIMIEDEADIIDKGLGGRAARYYREARQIFVNARYVAFARMSTQLQEEFAPFAERAQVERLAKQTAEWAIVQRLTRTLVHSLAKGKAGWGPDEVRGVQSPETLSLVVDDIDPLLGPARRRMGSLLGLETETEGGGSAYWVDPMAQRAAGELADAEAHLQRAMAANLPRLGPYYRQIGAIMMRQRNYAAARAWLEKGLAVDSQDPWCRYEYAGLLLAENDLDGAARAADEAMACASDNPAPFLRRRAEVEIRRGNLQAAEALLNVAAETDPLSPWAHYDLAALHIQQNNPDKAAAAVDTAMARSPVPSGALLRRRAEVDRRQGNVAAARSRLHQALALDPSDPWSRLDLANIHSAEGKHQAALEQIDQALEAAPSSPHHFYRLRSDIELQRGNRVAAMAAARRAIEADPGDAWCQYQVSNVLLAAGDLDGADQAAQEAIRLARVPSVHFYRRRAEIEARRRNYTAGLEILKQALAIDPKDPWVLLELSSQRMAVGDLVGAEEAVATALAGPLINPVHFLRRRSEIAFRRNDLAAAADWLNRAVVADPTDPWCRMEAASQLMVQGANDEALAKVQEAMALRPEPSPVFLRRAAEIEIRRGNFDIARDYLTQAMAAAPEDPQPWLDLSNLLAGRGDRTGAQAAAEKAMELTTEARERMLSAA
ncbi:tetratricopeptide repeat protein [Falsiroseomonas sp. E2-1-a20]|uniref:tetratricopeptide repeat protein n=1 Tax=Falsiroseomonas sp. E2-1-a20 TaxID=3239300 RepID=UPI003F2C9A1A